MRPGGRAVKPGLRCQEQDTGLGDRGEAKARNPAEGMGSF